MLVPGAALVGPHSGTVLARDADERRGGTVESGGHHRSGLILASECRGSARRVDGRSRPCSAPTIAMP